MSEANNAILVKMLDRLFAGVMSGPNLNCRPHSSRQRVDWTQLAKLHDVTPAEALRNLLSNQQSTQIVARVAAPPSLKEPKSLRSKKRVPPTRQAASAEPPVMRTSDLEHGEPEQLSPEEQRQRDEWTAQQSLLTKLRALAEDAREYEQDTGVHALHVGFPLLSLPQGTTGSSSRGGGSPKRLLAPIAFVPVSLSMRAGPPPAALIEGLNDGADFLIPNEALFAWIERQTGKKVLPDADQDRAGSNGDVDARNPNSDAAAIEQGSGQGDGQDRTAVDGGPIDSGDLRPQLAHDPWAEINDLVRRVAEVFGLPPLAFAPESLTELRSAPRADDQDAKPEIVPATVLGLFPMNNQGLLRDVQAMVAGESLDGPVQSFIEAGARLDVPLTEVDRTEERPVSRRQRQFAAEWLVSMADPCQARAVRLARECRGLVIHGPPGTGKSQTITNIIGDCLARGERVLLVCDKRTALDVVARRLEHMGLGSLCALIHDPQHDQRNLYRQVREQLEALTDTKTAGVPASRLSKVDRQLQKAHESLATAWSLVMERDTVRGVSFHERMGEWLETALPLLINRPANRTEGEETDADGESGDVVAQEAAGVTSLHSSGNQTQKRAGRRRKTKSAKQMARAEPVSAAMFDAHASDVRDILARATQIDFANHPWRDSAGLTLSDFMARSMQTIRDSLAELVEAARAADDTAGERFPPWLAPIDVAGADALRGQERGNAAGAAGQAESRIEEGQVENQFCSFGVQAAMRSELADRLEHCLQEIEPAWRRHWLKASQATVSRARQRLCEAAGAFQTVRAGPLDPELALVVRSELPAVTEINLQLGNLEAYLSVCGSWRGWLAVRKRARANDAVRRYGLASGPDSAKRLLTFLAGLRARRLVAAALQELAGAGLQKKTWEPLDDESLDRDWPRFELLFSLLDDCRKAPALTWLAEGLNKVLGDGDTKFIADLRNSVPHAESLDELQSELRTARLFSPEWMRLALERLCRGESITSEVERLAERSNQLEDVLRIRDKLAELPAPLRAVVNEAIAAGTDPDQAMNAVRYRVLSDDIADWLKSNPGLQAIDGKQLTNLQHEMRALEHTKRELVRDTILDLWISRQRDRLLASTGSRLSSLGADLRRRLTMRGERALRLRQVIRVGAHIAGGDPLFDLRPVWMASPETVAQIFPRQPDFDVVIFDEASQCRLEEALPVLTRAKRVVIAGDPKQLPPTRFFESAVVTSDDSDIETEQQLFEIQQGEIEDLLGAALSLDIQQSYLDVHYRSRNADLIEFSNEQFYASRLQAIPGHPKNRVRFAPITLYHVGGMYDDRANTAEAEQVCRIVADLLRRAEPPSIGIACFNITQRDLILDKLDELAAEDSDFAEKLAAARLRQGRGAFEGLFVKNLENVQGDERDHMIISTTYGPDKQGRFYKRFGPLGRIGGGRRLNVLVTRARDEVHLVTSIPKELYRSLPPIPAGQQPGGGWLLFAYLAYAERLATVYKATAAGLDGVVCDTNAGQGHGSGMKSQSRAPVHERPSQSPSQFASQLAQLLARRHATGSDVHWGNDGFCVDVALRHPLHPEDRTLGLLCDGTRFRFAEDPAEWDLFRTNILEDQGWHLLRLWTPQLFRDLEGHIETILSEASRIADSEPDPEAIPVQQD